MKRYWIKKSSLAIIVGMFLLGGLAIILYVVRHEFAVPAILPASGSEIGYDTTYSLDFPFAMEKGSVESRISATPKIEMDFQWESNRLVIKPGYAGALGDHFILRLAAGSVRLDGGKIDQDLVWTYPVRHAVIAYLGNATTAPEIWKADPQTGINEPVSQTGGRITGFIPLPDRKGFLYSLKNDQGGADIRLVNYEGSGDDILVDCGNEACTDPAISQDGLLFAFSRNRDPEDGTKSRNRYIYTSVLDGGQIDPQPVMVEKAVSGTMPSFSPDGSLLSFYDKNSKGIRVVNTSGGNDFLLGTPREQSGVWSSDGSKIAFLDETPGHDGITSVLYVVDIQTNTIQEPLTGFLDEREMGEPDWSPDGQKLVAGIRQTDGPAARQLWLIDMNGGTSRQITEDYSRMNAAPKWRADGRAIVYQQAELGRSNVKPVIILWDMADDSHTIIAEDAALPVWMP